MKLTFKEVATMAASVAVIVFVGMYVLQDDVIVAKHVWFYDLNTGELFVADGQAVAPIAAPSDRGGKESGVLAQVIRIEGEDELRVVFLQSFTPEAKVSRIAYLRNKDDKDANNGTIDAGLLVAAPPLKPGEPITWFALRSPEGAAVLMRISSLTGPRTYQACLPP